MVSTEENASCSMKYLKDKGTSSQKGIYYEQEVTASISLFALNYDHFSLISNPPNCAPFDDIILCTRRANRNVIYLFQVKRKERGALKDKEFKDQQQSKLFIGTLYEKYLKSKKSIQDVIPPFYREGCKFKIIIFTNRPIQENSEIFEAESDASMFTTNSGKFYKFNKTFIEMKFSKAREDFLQQINVLAGQNSISNESSSYIAKSFKTKNNIAQKIKSVYFKCIKNWWEIETAKECLTKDFVCKLLMYSAFKQFEVPLDNFKKDDYEKYKDIFLKSQNWEGKKKRHDKQYNEECLELLWNLIKNDKLVISDHHIQYILGKALDDLEDFNRQIDSDVYYYKQIISSDDSNPPSENQLQYYIGCLLDKLPFLVKNCDLTLIEDYFQNSKIVFIEANSTERKENLLEINENVLNTLKQLRLTTEFGQSFNLENIIKDIPNYISISDVFSLIIDAYNNKNNKKKALISMRLNKVVLDEKIFLEENIAHMKNDVFIITGYPAYEFMKYFKINTNRFIHLEDRNCEYFLEQNHENIIAFSIETVNDGQCKVKFSKQFKYIFLANENININTQNSGNFHFVRFVFLPSERIFRIQWLRTNGEIKNISKFRSNQICKVIQNEFSNVITFVYSCNCCLKLNEVVNYFQNNNSFMIISGVPGIGKTTILKQFAHTVVANDFIIYVALRDHYDYFKSYEKNFTKSKAEDHIHYFYNNKNNPILKRFFTKKLEKKEIIILLDGFDEIAPQYTQVVSEIINQIKKQNYKIILTTRTVLKNKVESLFATLSLTLTPLNLKERRMLHKIYFNKLGKSMNHHDFSSCVELNIRADKEFFNVPLNLHLFLELFVSEIKSLNDLSWDYKLNRLQLYEKFIKHRLEIYSNIHKNINSASIDRYHKYFAIKEIFIKLPEFNMIEDRLRDKLEDYIQDLQSGGEKVGILINDINEFFIHRTVAEYFSAKWLYDLFAKNDNNTQLITKEIEFGKFIIKILNVSLPHVYDLEYGDDKVVKFPVVKQFFDLMIKTKSSKLHQAAFEGNYEYIKKTLYIDIAMVQTLNNFNRNLLHSIIFNDCPKSFKFEGWGVQLNNDCILVIKLLINLVKDILIQEDCSHMSVHNYIQQNAINKDSFKVIIYKNQDLDQYVIYYNRPFHLWELFHPQNLFNCNIDELLNIMQFEQTKVCSIYSAVRDQNLKVIDQFIKSGIKMNFTIWRRLHLYHVAAVEGCLDIIKLLDTCGLQEKRKLLDINDRSLMHYAVVGGNLELVKYLEINEFDLYSCDEYDLSPFHYAIIFNKIDLVKYFLERAVHKVIHINKFNYLPIQYAAAFGNKEIFEILIKTGSSYMDGKPIHLISFINCCINTKIDSLTLLNNRIDKERQALLNNQNIYNKRCFDFVKFLLKEGYNINSESVGNITPFIIAIKFGNKKLVEYLIKNSADINNYTNEFGTTALHIAASNCDIEMLKLLLEHNFDINSLDKDMNSVLHYTFLKADKKIYFDIVDYSPLKFLTNQIMTYLQCWPIIIKYKRVHVSWENTRVFSHGNLSSIFDKKYSTRNQKTKMSSGNSLAIYPSSPPNTRIFSLGRCRALAKIFAYLVGSRDITIDYLIKNGVRPNIANDKGITPLHFAIQTGQFKTTKLLIKYTNVNVQTNEGNTPLHYAVLFQHFDILKYLIENGADINLTDKKNQTPLDLAYRVYHKDLNIISYLKVNNAIISNRIEYEKLRYSFYYFRFSESFDEYFKTLDTSFGFVSDFYWNCADFSCN